MTDSKALFYSGAMQANDPVALNRSQIEDQVAASNGEADSEALSTLDLQPFRGPLQRWPRTVDTILAFFSFYLTLQLLSSGTDVETNTSGLNKMTVSYALALVLALAGNFALLWRRRYPLRVHAVILGTAVLTLANPHLEGSFAVAFSLYGLGRYVADSKASFLGMLLAIAFATVKMFVLGVADAGSFVALGFMFLLWYVGRRLRFRGEYLRLLEERAVNLERRKTEEAVQAVAQERTRIARELHDVVAHQLSLMTVQAGAAKTVASSDPDAALTAMAAVESAGRQALSEMRLLLDVLRQDRVGGGLAPQPGFADLRSLAEEVTEAGTPVTLDVTGSLSKLPARVDLTLYRLVQEALTNVIKHAGAGACAKVYVRFQKGSVELTVSDDGRGKGALPGQGYGIAGMRERVTLLGGQLTTREGSNGGFVVEAMLPLEEDQK